MARSYHQGRFIPKYPHKYVGDVNNIFYRSGWETKFMVWADTTNQVLKWCSEETIIPYFDPVKQRMRRYFVDFAVVLKTNSGELKRYLIEIKPDKETRFPTGKRKTKQLNEAIMTYATNQAKWEAASNWAIKNGMEFRVLTEYELGIKKRPKNGTTN